MGNGEKKKKMEKRKWIEKGKRYIERKNKEKMKMERKKEIEN